MKAGDLISIGVGLSVLIWRQRFTRRIVIERKLDERAAKWQGRLAVVAGVGFIAFGIYGLWRG